MGKLGVFKGGWARQWRERAAARPPPPRRPRSPIARPYCLYCYAPLPPFDGASQACGRCGRTNLACDQGIYWTRERRIVELESFTKLCIAILIGWMSWAVLTKSDGFGTGQGWAVGAPILLGVYLWETAGKITRWGTELRAWIVWLVFLIVLGLLGAAFLLALALSPRDGPTWLAFLSPLPLLPAAATPFLARAFDRWRTRRILSGAGLSANLDAPSGATAPPTREPG